MAYKIKDPPQKSGILDEDELLSRKDRVLLFVEQNRTAIWVGVLLFVVVVVALGGVVWFDRTQTSQALLMEGKAQFLYIDRPVDNPVQAKENLEAAAELYRQILDQHPHTSSARRSLFLLGNTLMEQDDVKGAIEAYQQFIEQYPDDEMFLGIVYQRLGYAQLLSGNQDGATDAFSKVLELPQTLNKDQVLFEMAKLEEADSNNEKALTHYKQLMAEYPASPFFSEASLRVKILAPEDEPKDEGEGTEKMEDTEKTEEEKESPAEENKNADSGVGKEEGN